MSKQEIEQFLAEEHVGFAGASRQKSKFSNQVYRKLKESGHVPHPMHPEMTSLDGDACVAGVGQLPSEVRALMVVASPGVCARALADVSPAQISRVWVFPGSARPDVESQIRRLRDSGVSVVSGCCPLLFLEPVTSIHSFHRFIVRLFGKYPR